ncbi:MAG: aminoglycoside phosphotransferase [Robiginitomaculum sp.]|nr:MAG: aminoglycoside phosphotransferase [Robiginitomaculum sp.]
MDFEDRKKADAFLGLAGWDNAKWEPLVPDASTRLYFRLDKKDQNAILMFAPAYGETKTCPLDAAAAQRAALGYTAEARLAGNDCTAFLGIARELANRGFATPTILAADPLAGLVLLEDLGDALFANLLAQNPNMETELYRAAITLLGALARSSFEQDFRYYDHVWPVQSYDLTALLVEVKLLEDWYLPHCKVDVDANLQGQLAQAWRAVLGPVLQAQPVLVLRDFHAENLIWLLKRDGIAKVGLLDFQDAVFGHPAYDLVSLLQDARRDVEPELESPMIEQFLSESKWPDPIGFRSAYRVLGAQRAAKILGIFVRLAKRDGKSKYLELLPRVERHFTNNLNDPALAPVAELLRPLMPHLFSQKAVSA